MSLKGYNFNTKEDFYIYLRELIIATHRNLKKYERDINNFKSFLENENLFSTPTQLVTEEVYHNYQGILNVTFNYLCNLFGDQAQFGCSYQNYRKNIKKHASKLNVAYVKFTEEDEKNLNDVTTARDWGSHVPVSLIHSTINKAFSTNIDMKTPIIIPKFEKYDGHWLISLYDEHSTNLQDMKKLYEFMKDDFSVLTGETCKVIEYIYPVRCLSDLIIPKISYGIQKKELKTTEDVQNYYYELYREE